MDRPNGMRSVVVFVVITAAAVAAPLQRDLGQGLLLHRAQEVPRDLPPPDAQKRAVVLDLRYAGGDRSGAAALLAWMKFQASARTPVFVLANGETAPALRMALHDAQGIAGLMSIGVPGQNFHPDIPVTTTAEAERRAYDALQSGATVAAVLTDNPDKVRNDEASLSKDRLAEAAADAVTEPARNGTLPVDATLQRAVHLHRALLALKKL
jgi:hypothetical protein